MSARPDPLAVFDAAIDRLSGAGFIGPTINLKLARADVVILIVALEQADQWIREAKRIGCPLPAENTLAANRAALAPFGDKTP